MDPEVPPTDRPLRVVAVAGAPGTDALVRLVRSLPRDGDVATVVLSTADGLEAALRGTSVTPVVTLRDGDALAPARVHVVPPGQIVSFDHDRVHLTPSTSVNGTIDRLFRAIADRGRDAVAILVAGHGSDGVIGLKRIKEAGGLILAQTPEDAETPELPRNAIASGVVDVIASAAELGARLAMMRLPALDALELDEGRRSPDALTDALRDILTLVRIRSGHDFSGYKRATLFRRLARRMQVCGTETLRDYQRYLRDHPGELGHLLRDFLISVTSFFRDPDAFTALDEQVLGRLFVGKQAGDHVRVWVAGCATGEEAYSLAMLLRERGERRPGPHLQIFATDIDEEALAEARIGRYPDTIAVDVSPARLARFFEREGSYYRVRKELRELVLFSPHNLLRDPPFSSLDLVSCRNLLIYLNREAQDRVVNMFHFALRHDGHLFLGSSETAENAAMQFATVDAKHRVFVRRPAATPIGVDAFAFGARTGSPGPYGGPGPHPTGDRGASYGELHHRLVEQYAPPSVLVNDELDLVHLSEHAGRYLVLAGGEPSRQLMKLVVPELRLDLRSAFYAARQAPGRSETRTVRFEGPGGPRQVALTVRVVELGDVSQRLMLVLFDEQDPTSRPVTAPAPPATDHGIEPVVRELEDELHRTRDQLRTTIEQYETSLEELKASNEELHAINEELRSATEELETSKEELQSVNEELTTLNHELKVQIDEVSRVNGDLQNLMTSTDIGVVFLDRNLHLKRFTPRAQDLFNLIPTDLGRPLAHVTHQLDRNDLPQLAADVLLDLRGVEREVTAASGRRYLARLLPYRSLDDRIEGVVLTFVDVSELKDAERAQAAAEAALRVSEDRFRLAMRTTSLLLCWQDLELRYTWGHARGAPIEFVGQTDREAFPGPDGERLAALKREVLARGTSQRVSQVLPLRGEPRGYDLVLEPVIEDGRAIAVLTVGVERPA